MTDIVAAGNFAHRLAFAVAAADRLALLVFGHFRFAAKLDAARLGAFPPFAGSRADQTPLELSQSAEDSQDQAAMRRGGVGRCVANAFESGFLAGDRREGVQQVAGGSGRPIEPCHHHHVAVAELVEQTPKLRPVGLGSARHFAEHLARPCFLKAATVRATLWPSVDTRACP
jgi:hypothetical protein